MFEKFKLTLTGAASHSFGRKTYLRGKPVVSDDQDEVAWAMRTGRFKVEPVDEADPAPVDPEQAPSRGGVMVTLNPKEIARAVADGLNNQDPEPVSAEETPEPAPEPDPPDGRSWSDDALQALLVEPIKTIEPRLAELTVADLERLRELEEAEPDTRKTLLSEIDQELGKKR
ncbi:MAG: hypothetical protein KJ621_18230 [Proteobacteria bacterium]|nr:hypothetical protein [Pseudomonadota bacterium]MBU1742062.1 hypothetical protein [Pseudomonadota bacterium]